MSVPRIGRVTTLLSAVVIAAAATLLGARPAEAQQLVHRPTNPAFGGNPMNQQWLLSTAQAQKRFDEKENGFGRGVRDPLADFQQGLQRQILSALSREIIQNRFGRDGLAQGGRYDLGDFILDITPGPSGMEITILNVLTGAQTRLTIPGP
jgi:curli production assembly/transport component CsgF